MAPRLSGGIVEHHGHGWRARKYIASKGGKGTTIAWPVRSSVEQARADLKQIQLGKERPPNLRGHVEEHGNGFRARLWGKPTVDAKGSQTLRKPLREKKEDAEKDLEDLRKQVELVEAQPSVQQSKVRDTSDNDVQMEQAASEDKENEVGQSTYLI